MEAQYQSAAKLAHLEKCSPRLLTQSESAAVSRHRTPSHQKFPPLELVNRPTVPTDQAAYYLNRKPQTLREWAMTGKVVQPLRLNGRLAWPVAGIRAVLGATL